ncbi:MAG: hypothetical protein ACLQKH_09405 [Steroidobacteraceae bacterium]
MKDFIPKAVRDLLKNRWQQGAEPDPEPGWLICRWFVGDLSPYADCGPPVDARELKALLACGAIPSRFAYFTDGDEELGQLNDYAARSLQTCLYEACEAYQRHLDRMERHAQGFDLREWDAEQQAKKSTPA